MSGDVTRLLVEWSRGDQEARDALLSAVYDELNRLAVGHLRRERRGHTLQPTALVHEAYLRMIDQKQVNWQNRAHFFGMVSKLMRRILVDHARRRDAAKRGGGPVQVTWVDDLVEGAAPSVELLALDDALERMAKVAPRECRVVEMRFFGGLSVEEAAEALGTSAATVKRDWAMAKAWLYRELELASG